MTLASKFRSLGALAAAASVLLLAGCASVEPYAVANHDDKMSYHADAVTGLLTDQVFTTLAETQSYSSVGYTHAVASSGEALHVQHDTSVMDGTWWSRESTDGDGLTIDRIHMAGSSTTYYLFGEKYLPVSKTPWVGVPEGDVPRDAESVCNFPSVWYLCGIALAWEKTQEAHPDTLPVLVEHNADGATHLATAVTLRAIVDAGIFTIGDSLDSTITEETYETLLPLHVWFDGDGLVTKAEINGAFGSEPSLELQLGFEMTGTPSEEDKPVNPTTLDQQYVTMMSNPTEISTFWTEIGKIRQGG